MPEDAKIACTMLSAAGAGRQTADAGNIPFARRPGFPVAAPVRFPV